MISIARSLRRTDAGVSVTITSGASSVVNAVRAQAPASVAPAA